MAKTSIVRSQNDLSVRIFKFASNVILFLRQIPDTAETRVIKTQLIKAATSAGANYEESQAGVSRRDFCMKVGIALKEMREANYWLRILLEIKLAEGEEIESLIKESNELRLILGSIVTKIHKEDD